jgi:hypothetical protein
VYVCSGDDTVAADYLGDSSVSAPDASFPGGNRMDLLPSRYRQVLAVSNLPEHASCPPAAARDDSAALCACHGWPGQPVILGRHLPVCSFRSAESCASDRCFVWLTTDTAGGPFRLCIWGSSVGPALARGVSWMLAGKTASRDDSSSMSGCRLSGRWPRHRAAAMNTGSGRAVWCSCQRVSRRMTLHTARSAASVAPR